MKNVNLKITKKKLVIFVIILICFLIIYILIKSGIFVNKKKLSDYGIDGITFKAPSYWEINKDGKNINLYPHKKKSSVLNIMTQKIEDFDSDTDANYYLIIASMADSAEYYKLKNLQSKNFNDFKGVYAEYNMTIDNNYYDCYLNMFNEDFTDTVYSFNYCEQNKINKETRKQIDDLLSTIKER